jgi:hypothetical protein
MGVLPLQFQSGESVASLKLTGNEQFDVEVDDQVQPGQRLKVRAIDPDSGRSTTFDVICRIDTPVEVDYYRNGGILQTVLRKLLDEPTKPTKPKAGKKAAKKKAGKKAAKKKAGKKAAKKKAGKKPSNRR